MASSHAPTKNLWLQNDHQQRSFSRHNTTQWAIFKLAFKTEKIWVPMAPSACPLESYTDVVISDCVVLQKKMVSSHNKNL